MVKNRIIRKCVWIISARIFVSLEFLEFSELPRKHGTEDKNRV